MEWKHSINALSKQVISAREGLSSPLSLNVVFHVDGKLAPNGFEGVRTGRFVSQGPRLMVQAAVPAGEIGERRAVLLDLLIAAVDAAEAFAREKGIAERLDEIRALVAKL